VVRDRPSQETFVPPATLFAAFIRQPKCSRASDYSVGTRPRLAGGYNPALEVAVGEGSDFAYLLNSDCEVRPHSSRAAINAASVVLQKPMVPTSAQTNGLRIA